MRPLILFLFLLSFTATSMAQVIPSARTVDWSLAGLRDSFPEPANVLNILNFGGSGDSITNNDAALTSAIAAANNDPAVIYFPAGKYYFTSTFTIPKGIIIRGNSSSSTTFYFNCGGTGDLIKIAGYISSTSSTVIEDVMKDDLFIRTNATNLVAGDHIKLYQNDSSLVTSSWAIGSVAQIIRIESISGDTLFLESPVRRSFLVSEQPRIRKITPATGVGFECFKIERLDATTSQTSNFNFDFAANCWIKGVESNKANFAHVTLSNSTNIHISGCYFHHAFSYGGGGKAYGVNFQFSSGECLLENSIFNNLRHSILLQAGANGNVIAYNYSVNPYWTQSGFPTNSAGDIVLHGNYVYSNVFEGNICQNIVIDNSHGINGPYNTFFRNRAVLYGIVMNQNPASNDQNFVGNEVTNTSFPMGNYALSGTGHFQYGNNIKGTITPTGTGNLTDSSYFLTAPPFYFQSMPWPVIGPPYAYNQGTIPAKVNFTNGNFTICNGSPTGTIVNEKDDHAFTIYPNPCSGSFEVKSNTFPDQSISVKITDMSGRTVYSGKLGGGEKLSPGLYLVTVTNGYLRAEQKLVVE